jgi:hypothetical protein
VQGDNLEQAPAKADGRSEVPSALSAWQVDTVLDDGITLQSNKTMTKIGDGTLICLVVLLTLAVGLVIYAIQEGILPRPYVPGLGGLCKMDRGKIVLVLAALITVLMLLFPPFTFPQGSNAGYGFIGTGPWLEREYVWLRPRSGKYCGDCGVRVALLGMQWIAVWIVAGVAWFLLKDKKQ